MPSRQLISVDATSCSWQGLSKEELPDFSTEFCQEWNLEADFDPNAWFLWNSSRGGVKGGLQGNLSTATTIRQRLRHCTGTRGVFHGRVNSGETIVLLVYTQGE